MSKQKQNAVINWDSVTADLNPVAREGSTPANIKGLRLLLAGNVTTGFALQLLDLVIVSRRHLPGTDNI